MTLIANAETQPHATIPDLSDVAGDVTADWKTLQETFTEAFKAQLVAAERCRADRRASTTEGTKRVEHAEAFSAAVAKAQYLRVAAQAARTALAAPVSI